LLKKNIIEKVTGPDGTPITGATATILLSLMIMSCPISAYNEIFLLSLRLQQKLVLAGYMGVYISKLRSLMEGCRGER
jgi:hypothetical protein